MRTIVTRHGKDYYVTTLNFLVEVEAAKEISNQKNMKPDAVAREITDLIIRNGIAHQETSIIDDDPCTNKLFATEGVRKYDERDPTFIADVCDYEIPVTQ